MTALGLIAESYLFELAVRHITYSQVYFFAGPPNVSTIVDKLLSVLVHLRLNVALTG